MLNMEVLVEDVAMETEREIQTEMQVAGREMDTQRLREERGAHVPPSEGVGALSQFSKHLFRKAKLFHFNSSRATRVSESPDTG